MGPSRENVKLKVLQQVIGLAEAYGLPMSEARQGIYVEALIDIPIENLTAAIGYIIKTRAFAGNLPTVAEIREAANSQGESVESRIAIAWDKLVYALGRHGFYDSVKFDDPIIHHILTSWGGWRKWSGTVSNDEMKWARKDFKALYQAYAARPLPSPIEYFPGQIEHENTLTGWARELPKIFAISGLPGAFESRKEKAPLIEGPQKQIEKCL